MSVQLAVDPGLTKGLGLSLFQDWDQGKLIGAALIPGVPGNTLETYAQTAHRAADWVTRVLGAPVITRVVVEWPEVRSQARQRQAGIEVNPKWLLDLAAVCAFVCALFPGAYLVRYGPSEWKGSGKATKGTIEEKDSDPTWLRIEKRLSPAELGTVAWPAPSLRDNVRDAIGLGLKGVGRFERVRAIPR